MGRPKFAQRSTKTLSRSDPRNSSWMRDLQVQTTVVDTTRWTSQPQPELWHAFKPQTRARRSH